nr:MDR family MFS transporter [Clostridium guangxiense]
MFAIFAVSLIVFVIVELKISAPMVEFSLFKEPTFTASNICYLITGFGIMCPLLIFNYYIQNVLEYDTLKAAFIMMSVSLTTMFATPIGSILSKKIGTRIVNFLGILILGIATFKLSYVNADMTKGTMILDLIICGIGLGFSVQALSSSVKFIPKEKSGMGSGIINAARQIGSCIGIAILVSILNSNVSTAKDNIKNNVISYISNKNEIIKPVRTELIKVVSDNFKNTDSNRNTISQSSIEKSVEDIIKNNKSLFSKNASFYNNDTLKKLYDGTSIIRDGASKAANGQSSLNSGMKNLDNGLDGIYNGSVSLNYGLGTFNDGISKLAAGSQKLADGSQGITALINGITSLDSGSQKLIGQFSSSGDTSKPSLYDGITSVSDGTQKVSSGVNNYVAAVNSTLYMLVKNNADAAKVLDEYRTNLSKLENDKSQDIQQIKMLSNMVSIYTAAISSANESEFESKLAASQNVVSSGQTLKAGADNLQNGASKVEAQFKDRGAFKSGVAQLAAGAHKLSSAAASFTKLQEGIGTINTSISKLSNGSSKLYDGSSNLKNGMYKAKVGNDKLEDGSSKLVDASYKIKDGTETVVTSIGMAGQKGAIQSVMNKVKSEKNDKLSTAFSKTFLISSIIVMISSIFGLFTDKNVKIEDKSKEYDDKALSNL